MKCHHCSIIQKMYWIAAYHIVRFYEKILVLLTHPMLNSSLKNWDCQIQQENQVYSLHCKTSLWISIRIWIAGVFFISFQQYFVSFRYSDSLKANALRKAQTSQMAIKHVAEGIKHFKSGKSIEAFNSLNHVIVLL